MSAAMAWTRRWAAAVRDGWAPDASSTAPTVAAGRASSAYGTPLMVAMPASGRTSPSSARRVVVLPAPLGPRNPVTVPASTEKDRSSTAVTPSKCLVSPWISMVCMAAASDGFGAAVVAQPGSRVACRSQA